MLVGFGERFKVRCAEPPASHRPPPHPVNIRSRRRTFSTLTVTSHCANSRRHRSDGTWGSHRSPRGFRGHGGPGWGEEVPRELRLPRAPPVLAAKSSAGLSRKQMMMQNPVKRRSLQRRRRTGAARPRPGPRARRANHPRGDRRLISVSSRVRRSLRLLLQQVKNL